MFDYIRIGIQLISFGFCLNLLFSVDFTKVMRKGHESKAALLRYLCAMALSYLVAQFLFNLTINLVY